MTKPVEEWNDERLNDLAATLQPMPTQVAILGARAVYLEHLATQMEPVPGQMAVLAAGIDHLAHENRVLRTELAAVQRQLVQISWALVAALLGAGTAVVSALI